MYLSIENRVQVNRYLRTYDSEAQMGDIGYQMKDYRKLSDKNRVFKYSAKIEHVNLRRPFYEIPQGSCIGGVSPYILGD